MKTIVTGGAGFIGSHLVDELVHEGADVLVVDNLSRGSKHNLADAQARGTILADIDVRDEQAVTAAFTEFRPDVVFHLAAQIDVRASMAQPGFDASVKHPRIHQRLCRGLRVRRSTCCQYVDRRGDLRRISGIADP